MASDLQVETITASATKAPTGKIYVIPTGHHHYHVYKEMIGDGIDPHTGVKGFITSTGRFVDRHEAFIIAEKANQLTPSANRDTRKLISDDLCNK